MPNLPQQRGFEANSEVHSSQSLVLSVGARDGPFQAKSGVAPLSPDRMPAHPSEFPDAVSPAGGTPPLRREENSIY